MVQLVADAEALEGRRHGEPDQVAVLRVLLQLEQLVERRAESEAGHFAVDLGHERVLGVGLERVSHLRLLFTRAHVGR